MIVFVFAYRDEEVRPKIAAIRGVKPNDVQVDALGDLRIMRKSIIHNAGILAAPEYAKLKVLQDVCQPEARIALTHDQMHRIFVAIKQSIRRSYFALHWPLAGRPKCLRNRRCRNTARPRVVAGSTGACGAAVGAVGLARRRRARTAGTSSFGYS